MKISNDLSPKPINLSRENKQIIETSEIKIERLRMWIKNNGFSAILLSHRDNFAWLTTGGDAVLIESSSNSIASLLITLNEKFLIGREMDVYRLSEEQLPGQGYEIIAGKWFEANPQLRATQLSNGRIACDTPIPGMDYQVVDIHHLHYPLCEIELDRLRWLGATVNNVYLKMASLIKRGMTENDLAITFRHELDKMHIRSAVSIVGSDERAFKYRHPMPTKKQIEKYVMLHTGARRWGLHAPITRNFHFGTPPQIITNAYQSVAQIQARTFSLTRPGVSYREILNAEKVEYEKTGFKNEWQAHYQGGPTGYRIVNPVLGLSDAVIQTGTAFEWFSTVPGMKIAELTILTENGLEIPSLQEDKWPKENIILDDGYSCQIPGIFILN